MHTDTLADRPDSPAPFLACLTSDSDVLRAAAIRALAALGPEAADDVRAALLQARRDPDPDIRSDAVEALIPLARAGDAAALRESLTDDPVREVKLGAITALARLRDTDALPVLRALVTSRSEDQVSWEDAAGDWEDWLDIQNAAIRALGEIGDLDGIQPLLDALFDKYGQSVDLPVCHAFSKLGDSGVAVLLDIFTETDGALSRRAAEALRGAAPDSLLAHVDALLAADQPGLRALALTVLPPDAASCNALALEDPDATVRAAAMRHAGTVSPELARAGLSDPDAAVKAAALYGLGDALEPEFQAALIDNMLLWLDRAAPVLANEAAARLPGLAPDRAVAPLLRVIDTAERPLETRLAAVKALGDEALDVALPVLTDRLDNPSRQVRAALLTVLRDRATAGDLAALEIAAAAIEGRIGAEITPLADDPSAPVADAGTPKEGSGPARIRITPEGDIVERDDSALSPDDSGSTLDAILAGGSVQPPAPAPMAEQTPEESGAKRARRRAVEGSGDSADALAVDALRIFAELPGDLVTDAVATQLTAGDATRRSAAWQAMAARDASDAVMVLARQTCRDSDPVIRAAAFRVLSKGRDATARDAALQDEDALIRADAVTALSCETALEFVADAAPPVRQAAIARVLGAGAPALAAEALDAAIKAERADAVATLVARSDAARSRAMECLQASAGDDRRALVLLRGFEMSAEVRGPG